MITPTHPSLVSSDERCLHPPPTHPSLVSSDERPLHPPSPLSLETSDKGCLCPSPPIRRSFRVTGVLRAHPHHRLHPGKLTMTFVFYMLTGIPFATSVDVERTFSQGRLLLSHVRSRLWVQSTRALLCVGVWSLLDLVKDEDVNAAAVLPELDGPEDRLVKL